MLLDGHSSIPQMVLKGILENLAQLLHSLPIASAPTNQVTIDSHYGLIVYFESEAHCAFVASRSQVPCFDLAGLKLLFLDALNQLSLEEHGDVAANHARVHAHH